MNKNRDLNSIFDGREHNKTNKKRLSDYHNVSIDKFSELVYRQVGHASKFNGKAMLIA